MASYVTSDTQRTTQMSSSEWVKLGLVTAIVSIVAVLALQALAIAQWPEIALFAPLDSYARSALFTFVPVVIATFLLAWLVGRQPQRAIQRFITISVIILLISFIPDYILPVPNKTVLASTVAAFLHVVAALITVFMLVTGYQRHVR